MIYTQNNKENYERGYSFGINGSAFGFILIILPLAPLRLFLGAVLPKYEFGWSDCKASIVGAWEGMTHKDFRFKDDLR